MDCSTRLALLPIPPRLPHALVVVLILSFLLQTGGPLLGPRSVPRPPLLLTGVPRSDVCRAGHRYRRTRLSRAPWFGAQALPRVLARSALLALLLHLSGWPPLGWGLLLLPASHLVCVRLTLARTDRIPAQSCAHWAAHLQRLYQVTLVLLLLHTLTHLLSRVPTAGLGFPLLVGGWVWQPDEATEIAVTATAESHYTVTLRGAFTLVWEPRDAFERWLVILFLRRFHRPGDPRPLLTQAQVAEAFDLHPAQVGRWEQEVRQHSWHILSDRFRRDLHSALPNPELSRRILQVWVPAFWLSAWEVRERLIQLGTIPNRDALELEDLHALAQHTGFNQVRDLLLKRFDLQAGHLLAHEHWWLEQLLALNERLLTKLQRGERLTPQDLVEIEPLRLKTSEKQALGAPPLAATLQHTLFEPSAEIVPTPVRCTYCGSDQVAPKSKQPRLKTVSDEAGAAHTVETLRYYCHNPACAHGSFTHFPPGVLPPSAYPVQVRLLALEVYVGLLSTYRRSARVLGVKASTVYGWLVTLSPSATALAAYLGVIRTSGVIGIDDKWLKVCSPSAVPKHGQHPHAIWAYAYFAIDMYSYDLLALEVYPEHNDAAVRQFLLELKAQGVQPRIVVSDLDPAYGRMLPQIFPQAVHHECIFHAIQNAQRQLTQVYGKHYVETVPAAAVLHQQIVELFHAQTQKTVRKRFAELLALRAAYVQQTPAVACVFDSLETHFPKLVNAIEGPLIPRTNDATERVIRRLDQHYLTMCGLDSLESARVYLRLFQLVYRLTPLADDNPGPKRGQSPLELAGYDLTALPIADFFRDLQLPALAQPAKTLSQ